jgi:hypothetical protein
MPIHRNRLLYALAIAIVIAAGLLWRSGLLPLPNFLIKYGGDALWAVVVFFGFGLIFPRSSTIQLALLALVFAWSVEFFQLYHADWIDGLRATRLGKLVLGSTFNVPDLFAYVTGIVLGALAEWVYLNKKRGANQQA